MDGGKYRWTERQTEPGGTCTGKGTNAQTDEGMNR